MEITRQTKVNLKFDLEITHDTLPKETTIEGYMETMKNKSVIDRGAYEFDWGYLGEFNELGEVKTIIYAIISYLSGYLEVDNLFYTIKDNEIYIDRLQVKEQVR